MKMYCGIDLHSNNSYLAIMNRDLEDVACRRVPNRLDCVLEFLEPYRSNLESVSMESTYNWYWLADGIEDSGYNVKLMNTTKACRFSDMKYRDDRHDARWIAKLLALGILPEGYIVPREDRAVRDLLRRRAFFVQKRTAHLLSVGTVYQRSTGKRAEVSSIHDWKVEDICEEIQDPVIAQSITIMLPVIQLLTRQIRQVEKTVLESSKLRDEFQLLRTVPGIGKVIALTIMCETADIGRFPKASNYVSYCRCAKTEHISNKKKKGAGNRKNGNKYLSWAYSEAAHHIRRYCPAAQRYYSRKRSRSLEIVAKRAMAAKLARACYYVLRDQKPFDPSRVFH
ncbi:MAG: IS110 family transposase [bacterium]|nr:IS110 family transposase [bacterium]